MEQTSTVLDSRRRGVLPLLAFGVFAVGTEGLVFAGLLPKLASDLDVSVGAAGQVTTVFALAYAIAAPLLSMLTETWRPRLTLLAGFALFTLGNVLTALAPSLAIMLCWRVLTAAGAALITPTSTMVAAGLAVPERRARAISVVMTGLAVATALGAPLGTLIGGAYGWRATIWAIAALGVIAGAVQGIRVSVLPGHPRRSLRTRLQPLTIPAVRRILATTLVGFVSIYVFYAYVSVVYAPLTRSSGFLATILLTIGVAGIVGNLVAGGLTDKYGARIVVTTALVITAVAALVAGLVSRSPISAVATAALYGVAAWSITGPQQHRLLTADTGHTGLPVALNSSAMYLAISIAGALGGLFASSGRWPILAVAAVAALIAAAISAMVKTRETQPVSQNR